MRRSAMLALSLSFSLSLLLGLSGANPLFAQGDAKKDEAKAQDKATPKTDAPKADAAPKKDEPPPPIPPDVERKLEAARRAVAEAIVAAQDAGLVKTSIDPPPILDILITGRANDEAAVKAKTGVSPEVFGAWFTGFGTTSGINPQADVRIINPSDGLKAWYQQRADILRREIDSVRKAKGTPAEAKKEEMKKDEAPKKEETPKKEEAPKKDEAKKDEVKKEEPKKEEAKKEEAKKEEPAKEESPKKDEAKKDEGDSKKDDSKKDDK